MNQISRQQTNETCVELWHLLDNAALQLQFINCAVSMCDIVNGWAVLAVYIQ